ncbi:MAG: DUF4404 family protein [Elusimicrobia bacterium]|nr:DUF4404 family protein [Elusimicrobiota bacterium]
MDDNLKKKFDTLKREIGNSPKADARTRQQLAAAVAGLRAAGAEFEATHPSLTALVDEICRELAELGI